MKISFKRDSTLISRRKSLETEINPKRESLKLLLLIGIALGISLTILNCLE